MASVNFKTRARAIDHLGRGQIADTPTAISELWKNAYDADATSVALHIFDGPQVTAAIFDDGQGMNEQDLLEKWLVIGTESKLQGLDSRMSSEGSRPRQGEKGIGRLAVAFLAPITVLMSKKSRLAIRRRNGGLASL